MFSLFFFPLLLSFYSFACLLHPFLLIIMFSFSFLSSSPSSSSTLHFYSNSNSYPPPSPSLSLHQYLLLFPPLFDTRPQIMFFHSLQHTDLPFLFTLHYFFLVFFLFHPLSKNTSTSTSSSSDPPP